MQYAEKTPRIEFHNDNFQNFKKYNIPKAQLVIADIPYNIGVNFYGSSPLWYNGGDNRNGESFFAKKAAFHCDFNFNIAEYFHFCHKLLKKEDTKPLKRGTSSNSPCMIVFCAFEQMELVKRYGQKYGFKNSIPLFFVKKTSGQVLKANMRIVGAMEYAVLLYRDRLPKFRNNGKMVLNWFEFDTEPHRTVPKVHPTQKPLSLMRRLIALFTDKGDVVIDPAAGSGITLAACRELGRSGYGFEINRTFYREGMAKIVQPKALQMSLLQ